MEAQAAAVLILIFTYIVLFLETHNRAIAAIIGGLTMVVCGIITQQQAISGIDFNTIFLLVGMMVLVGTAEKSGIFEYAAIFCAKISGGNPRGLLATTAILTAVFSALFDNVTTILLIVPIILKITKIAQISPYPYLISAIFASNIGGTATLIGDPPNILIGSALNLSFTDFIIKLAPISIIALVLMIIIFDFMYKNKLKISKKQRAEIMQLVPGDYIIDRVLAQKSLFVLAVVTTAFAMAEILHLENGTIALSGAAILLFLQCISQKREQHDKFVAEILSNVDWTTIFFFSGLFIMVHGLSETGVLAKLGTCFLEAVDGSVKKATFLMLWGAAGLSAIIDNIPFVATMIPMIKSIEPGLGGRATVMPIWWALSLGACFGGNGSLIASSANVIAAGLATKHGNPIKFGKFLLWSLPITLITLVAAHFYLLIIYFTN